MKLLEVLRQGPPAQIDLAGGEKLPDPLFPLRGGQPHDPAAHAAEALLRELAVQGVPVGFDEVPGQLSAIDAHQDRADHEGGVLRPDLAVDGAGEGLVKQVPLLE